LPSSNHSSSQRRPSGARHSSPKKAVQFPTSINNEFTSTPPQNELANLLDNVAVNSPSLHLASAAHLTTSTPFQQGLNLSSVILNHMTNCPAISPLVNPDTSISPASLDVSTISPDVYKSVVSKEPIHCTPNPSDENHIPPRRNLDILKDYAYPEILASHTAHLISIPVSSDQLTASMSMVLKITDIWMNSTAVPPEFWCNLIDCNTEQVVSVTPSNPNLTFRMIVKRAGMLTLNFGVVQESGSSSSGLLRIQFEEPNIQVLTDDGSRINFGNVVEGSQHSVPFVIVNCGRCTVPLVLELQPPSDIFRLEEDQMTCNFSLPGVNEECSTPGKGVARETFLTVNTKGMICQQTKVLKTQLNVYLGTPESNITLLGELETSATVGPARLKIHPNQEPLLFSCVSGETVSQKVNLKNSGTSLMRVGLKIDDCSSGKWKIPSEILIPPGEDVDHDIEFSCTSSEPLETSHTYHLTILPGGPRHEIRLQVQVLDSTHQFYRSSKPGLKMGTIKRSARPDLLETSSHRAPQVFPVESDRSLLNFLNVGIHDVGLEQSINLRNPTTDIITLTLIIREATEFFIKAPVGLVQSTTCQIEPLGTEEIRVLFKPKEQKVTTGKLVLKPQSRSVDRKTFKATIGLCGYPGEADVRVLGEGLALSKHNSYKLTVRNSFHSLDFVNHGSSAGFVKILCKGNDQIEANPSQFVLEKGQKMSVGLSVPSLQGRPSIQVFHGPELCRQVLRTAGDLNDLTNLVENQELLGVDFTSSFDGEGFTSDLRQVTALDVLQFYDKCSKVTINLATPQIFNDIRKFEGLSVEDTLSETRIDQSIALPLRSSHQVFTQPHPPQSRLVHSPPIKEESKLQLHPRQLTISRGSETVVRLLNKGESSVHWDLSWPGQHLDITPSSGCLSPESQAVLCISARHDHQGASLGAWKGQVSVYSDNEVVHLDVSITPGVQQPCLSVVPKSLDIGSAVLGATVQGVLNLVNTSNQLVQWKGIVEPSFFSLPQPGGILNPSQSMNLPVHFKPAAPGVHLANLSLVSHPLRGNGQEASSTPPIIVTMRGTAITHSEVSTNVAKASSIVNPVKNTASVSARKTSGVVSLESDELVFQDTKLGHVSIGKVKIKNRSGCDHILDVCSFEEGSPFKVGHTSVEVKNSTFTMLPIQFKPSSHGQFQQKLTFRYEGDKILVATLRGSCSSYK